MRKTCHHKFPHILAFPPNAGNLKADLVRTVFLSFPFIPGRIIGCIQDASNAVNLSTRDCEAVLTVKVAILSRRIKTGKLPRLSLSAEF